MLHGYLVFMCICLSVLLGFFAYSWFVDIILPWWQTRRDVAPTPAVTEYPYRWDSDDRIIDDIEYSIAGGVVSVRYQVSNTRTHGTCSLDNPLLAFQRGVSLPVVESARPVTLLRGASFVSEARFRLLWDGEPIVFHPVESKENQ